MDTLRAEDPEAEQPRDFTNIWTAQPNTWAAAIINNPGYPPRSTKETKDE
jgi:hypothetical protein